MLFEPVRTANDPHHGATRDPTGLQADLDASTGLAGKPALARVLALDPVATPLAHAEMPTTRSNSC